MATLKRYTLSVVLWALALILVVVGILGLTVWRPYQEVRVSLDPSAPYVVTKPGVLGLFADKSDIVKVEVEAPGTEAINIAVGAGIDVQQWVAGKTYQEVSGMADADTLKSELVQGDTPAVEGEVDAAGDAEGEQPQSGDVNPLASDMWYDIYQGHGEYNFTVPRDRMDSSLLIATNGTDPAPRLTLVWPTPTANALAWAAFVSAFLLAAVGVVAAFIVARPRPHSQRAKVPGASKAVKPELADEPVTEGVPATKVESAEAPGSAKAAPAKTEPTEVAPDQAQAAEEHRKLESDAKEAPSKKVEAPSTSKSFPSRRALREAHARGEATITVGGEEFATGAIPVVPTAGEDENKAPKSASSDPAEVLSKRAMPPMQWRSKRGAQRFGPDQQPKDEE